MMFLLDVGQTNDKHMGDICDIEKKFVPLPNKMKWHCIETSNIHSYNNRGTSLQ